MSRIPKMDSVTEMARFWDEHDLVDFEDALEEVEERVFEGEGETIFRVRLRPQQAAALRRLAMSQGVGIARLIQEWVNEKLRAM